jgi:hypothetical protein
LIEQARAEKRTQSAKASSQALIPRAIPRAIEFPNSTGYEEFVPNSKVDNAEDMLRGLRNRKGREEEAVFKTDEWRTASGRSF